MKPDAIQSAMLQVALKKGIRDIRENPGRGLRNLVELGEMLSSGRFQKAFFHTALMQVQKNNGVYYQLVAQLVEQFDTDALCRFGINLGYNALSHGGSEIRKIEEAEGFNVPWCLTIDTRPANGQTLPPDAISNMVSQGKQLGIYCYLIQLDTQYPFTEHLLQQLQQEDECAYILMCEADCITPQFCAALRKAPGTGVLLSLDNAETPALICAVQQLATCGNVYGGLQNGDNFSAQDITDALANAEQFELLFLTFWRSSDRFTAASADFYEQIVATRENLTHSVVPVDLFGDIAYVDRTLSTEACIAYIEADGNLILVDAEQGQQKPICNICEMSLRDALRLRLPKQ